MIPGLKKPLPMLSVCLPELPLLDLVRVAIFSHLLIFSKNLHLLSPKRKVKPLQITALSYLLLRPLPLNSGRHWAEGLHSLKQHFSWGKQRSTSSESPGRVGGRQVNHERFLVHPRPTGPASLTEGRYLRMCTFNRHSPHEVV